MIIFNGTNSNNTLIKLMILTQQNDALFRGILPTGTCSFEALTFSASAFKTADLITIYCRIFV